MSGVLYDIDPDTGGARCEGIRHSIDGPQWERWTPSYRPTRADMPAPPSPCRGHNCGLFLHGATCPRRPLFS